MQNRTVLIVEDNEFNRDALSRVLRRKGYQVATAETGEDALAAAALCRSDIVLMDIGLPDIDGYEVTRRLKADSSLASIPILVLTAHAFEEDRQMAADAGAEDFDTKPIDTPRLLRKIEALLKVDQGSISPVA